MDNVKISTGYYTKDNLKQIAELIYLTDPYIYKDLLFSVDNAKRLLPLAIMQTNTIFSHENIVSLKYHNDIIAIAYYIDSRSIPENIDLIPFFKKCNITPAKTYLHVYINYIEQIMEEACMAEGIHLICFCVDPLFRSKKLGSYLMQEFVNMFSRRKIYLEVLANNTNAVCLYTKFGFNVTRQYIGYPGSKQTQCFKMCRCRPM